MAEFPYITNHAIPFPVSHELHWKCLASERAKHVFQNKLLMHNTAQQKKISHKAYDVSFPADL